MWAPAPARWEAIWCWWILAQVLFLHDMIRFAAWALSWPVQDSRALNVSCFSGRVAKALFSGNSHTCAHLSDGSIICWGDNTDGQLGVGSVTDIGLVSSDMGQNLQLVQLGVGASITQSTEHLCLLLTVCIAANLARQLA